jgi:hypothetical protein
MWSEMLNKFILFVHESEKHMTEIIMIIAMTVGAVISRILKILFLFKLRFLIKRLQAQSKSGPVVNIENSSYHKECQIEAAQNSSCSWTWRVSMERPVIVHIHGKV